MHLLWVCLTLSHTFVSVCLTLSFCVHPTGAEGVGAGQAEGGGGAGGQQQAETAEAQARSMVMKDLAEGQSGQVRLGVPVASGVAFKGVVFVRAPTKWLGACLLLLLYA